MSPKDKSPSKPILGDHVYRFDKRFYARTWFWIWSILLLTDAGLITLSAVSGWFFPCVSSQTGYNNGHGYVTTCNTEQGGRIVSAIGSGLGTFCCLLCVNLVVLIIWMYWTFVKKPEIKKRQFQANVDVVRSFNPDGTFPDDLPNTDL